MTDNIQTNQTLDDGADNDISSDDIKEKEEDRKFDEGADNTEYSQETLPMTGENDRVNPTMLNNEDNKDDYNASIIYRSATKR